MRRVEIAAAARRDLRAILLDSQRRFGPAARRRYRLLIEFAFDELAGDPKRGGGREAEGAPGLRLYPLRHAACSIAPADRVRAPAHVVAYHFDQDRVEIVRLLHEAMDIPRRLATSVAPERLDMIRENRAHDDPDAGGED